MKTQYPQNMKTDQFGEVDVNYYIAKGRRLRADATANLLQRFIAKLKSKRSKTQQLPLNVNFRH